MDLLPTFPVLTPHHLPPDVRTKRLRELCDTFYTYQKLYFYLEEFHDLPLTKIHLNVIADSNHNWHAS